MCGAERKDELEYIIPEVWGTCPVRFPGDCLCEILWCFLRIYKVFGGETRLFINQKFRKK